MTPQIHRLSIDLERFRQHAKWQIAPMDWSMVPPLQRKGIAMKQLAAMIRSFPPGVTGLVVAGLLAATMSSIDSGINACSAAYVTDFHRRWGVVMGHQSWGNGHR